MIFPLCKANLFNKEVNPFLLEQIEVEIKYSGYLVRQSQAIKEMQKMEKHILGENFDYDKVNGLRLEAREKLKEIKPLSLAQASRISGVNPADITMLILHIKKKN